MSGWSLGGVTDKSTKSALRVNLISLITLPSNNLLLLIQCVLCVTGLNGLVVYSISPQLGAVRVDPSDGSLFLNYPLDRELNSTYHLVLTASDNGLPKLSTFADVWLHGKSSSFLAMYSTKSCKYSFK